jgi:DNA-binding response OmpR family regulator
MHRILIIDDDIQFNRMLKQTLEKQGYEVTTAQNGREGIQYYQKNPMDLVVTDLIMPEKEGVETIMELKRNYPDVKIVAMSGGGRIKSEDLLRIVEGIGVDATFSKPFEREDFLNTIKNLLNH